MKILTNDCIFWISTNFNRLSRSFLQRLYIITDFIKTKIEIDKRLCLCCYIILFFDIYLRLRFCLLSYLYVFKVRVIYFCSIWSALLLWVSSAPLVQLLKVKCVCSWLLLVIFWCRRFRKAPFIFHIFDNIGKKTNLFLGILSTLFMIIVIVHFVFLLIFIKQTFFTIYDYLEGSSLHNKIVQQLLILLKGLKCFG